MRYRFIILSYNIGKDGKTAVTLRITKNRKRKYINTGLRASPGPRKDAQAISLHVLLLRHLIHRRRNAHKEQFGELQLRHIHSLQAKQDNGDYLLPIVSVPGYSGERLYSHIRGRYKHFSRNLNNLGLAIGLKGFRLTSYVARHTMAMTLQEHHVPREIISQILGHKDLSTTSVYLDSFADSIIDEAARVL